MQDALLDALVEGGDGLAELGVSGIGITLGDGLADGAEAGAHAGAVVAVDRGALIRGLPLCFLRLKP